MSKEAVVKVETTEVAVNKPVRGLEGANMEGISFPRTKIMQPTSPELADSETLRLGDVINTLTLEKLPKTFIPLMVWDSNILFTPRDEKPEDKVRLIAVGITEDDMQASAILCNAREGRCGDRFGDCAKCGLNKFDNLHNTKPVCMATVNVMALFDGVTLPIIIQFAATSLKHGNKFKQMLLFSGGDVFSRRYSMASVKKSQTGKTWYELTVAPAGKCTDDEYIKAEQMYRAAEAQKEEAQRQAQEQTYENAAAAPVDEAKEY